MSEMQVLRSGAVALVTGASSGIGQAIAEDLLSQGLKVICAARRRDKLAELFGGRAEQALVWPLDVTEASSVTALPDSLPAGWREVEIVVANAGSDVGGRRHFDAGEMADWAATIETNVTGLMRVCHALLPAMVTRGRGHLVTLGSIAGLNTYAGGAVYSASKYAVRAFTEALRREYKNAPIRITEILPGMVRTGFAEARFRGDAKAAAEFYDSFPATLTAADIAASVRFALGQPPHVNIAQIVVTPTGDK